MTRHRRYRAQGGFTLIDVLAASVIATFLAAAFITLQFTVVQGVAAINQQATSQIALAQATDQMLRDFSSARGAATSWNGMNADNDSAGDGIARSILEVPDPSSIAVAHVVYEYLGVSPNYQLKRKYYAPGSTTLTNTRVVANSVDLVQFGNCPYTLDPLTQCVQPSIRMRSDNALWNYKPTLTVRATYCNT